jgi:hypothetical protein
MFPITRLGTYEKSFSQRRRQDAAELNSCGTVDFVVGCSTNW